MDTNSTAVPDIGVTQGYLIAVIGMCVAAMCMLSLAASYLREKCLLHAPRSHPVIPAPVLFIDQLLLEAYTCTICAETTEKGCILKCHHRFHADCINTWLQHSNTCPYCRAIIYI